MPEVREVEMGSPPGEGAYEPGPGGSQLGPTPYQLGDLSTCQFLVKWEHNNNRALAVGLLWWLRSQDMQSIGRSMAPQRL